ncbi:phosphoribosylanthranilate isomerase [Chelativorans sp. AA-79]|uniref:phosphoribosylanthranilate isomerase n=1 Tax=Chelativorans sp. AA-79 TaxID=3028735 RepID=UPI0023F7E2B5|nr:phosphoribosylanthranilate isomerase [Chelativorans sp. AA-79]WEX08155.1 phosphoribosylanthranilate isomerase [Chelativorans sp. AA-79]
MKLDIKICGLKTEGAIAAALDGGASHVGFIFFPKSPRNVEVETAARLRQAATGRAKAVAVTVDADDETLERIVEGLRPDMLQLHGRESPERLEELKARYGLPVMKAISVREARDLEAAAAYQDITDHLLLDAKPPAGAELPGGNGVPFDWALLASLDGKVDYMLSGGLNAANIGEALNTAKPRGIDVSSGVERAPGEKDPDLIRAFFSAVQTARGERE